MLETSKWSMRKDEMMYKTAAQYSRFSGITRSNLAMITAMIALA